MVLLPQFSFSIVELYPRSEKNLNGLGCAHVVYLDVSNLYIILCVGEGNFPVLNKILNLVAFYPVYGDVAEL